MGFLTDLFGSKPNVPTLTPIDMGQVQQKTIAQNQAALPGAEALGGQVNQFNQDQLLKMLRTAIPGFDQQRADVSSNIEQYLQGQIPEDVQSAISRADTARGLSLGVGGSGLGRDLVARDLGLTSLKLTEQGISSAENWMRLGATAFTPAQFNVSSMFYTPQQGLAFATEERSAQFQRQWMQNQIDAMPDPVTVGLWNTSWSIVDSVLSAYTGGNFSGMGKTSATGADYSRTGNVGGGPFGNGTYTSNESFGNESQMASENYGAGNYGQDMTWGQ